MTEYEYPIPPENYAAYPEHLKSAGELFGDYLTEIAENQSAEPISIGFPLLQDTIRAVLNKGLICIGAAPSAGKTTLIMQIANSIATNNGKKQPRNVLIFALEMSRNELIAREISRLSYVLPKISGSAFKGEARTASELLDGATYDNGQRVLFTENQAAYIKQVQDFFKYDAGQRLYIYEGAGTVTADTIADTARQFVKDHPDERPPVIFVDYLQLLSDTRARADARQTADQAAFALKQLSRELKTPVFVVSSTARNHYYETDPEGFGKESGGIEYSADTTLFLQYKQAFEYTGSEREAQIKTAASADTREIIISIIKNRAGQRNIAIKYEYLPKYNAFRETSYYILPYGAATGDEQKSTRRTKTTGSAIDDYFSNRR